MILLWLARNIDRFCDSWMDWGSDIFLRNWAALEHSIGMTQNKSEMIMTT